MVQNEKELIVPKEWWEDECYSDDAFTYPNDMPRRSVEPDPHVVRYELVVPDSMLNRTFSVEEKRWLRPICETLAMLQGNAFFGIDPFDEKNDWYEQWLPEAAAIFYSNGGLTGWAGEASWMKDLAHESESVELAWRAWKALKTLSRSD